MSNLSEQQQLEQEQQRQPRPRLGLVTIHDACPALQSCNYFCLRYEIFHSC
jgi:hypothetical protein